MSEDRDKMPQSLDLSLEEFSIEELEDRLELMLISDNNCKCHTSPGGSPPSAPPTVPIA